MATTYDQLFKTGSIKYGNTATTNPIDNLYGTVLGRTADTSGKDYWSGAYKNGTSLTDITKGFLDSNEYQQQVAERAGAVNNDNISQALTDLYSGAFSRDPDAAGLEYWSNAYKNGDISYEDIEKTFYQSPEFQVNQQYVSKLGRTGDDQGIQHWTGQIQKGLLDINDLGKSFDDALTGFGYSTNDNGLWQAGNISGDDGIVSASEIRDYAASLRSQGLTDDAINGLLYDAARANGISTSQIDQAFNWDAGTTESWTENKQFTALLGGADNAVAQYSPKIAADLQAYANVGTNAAEKFAQAYTAAALSNATVQDVAAVTGLSESEVIQFITALDLDELEDKTKVQENPMPSTSNWQNSAGADERQVDPTTMTVQGQLDGLLAKNNPLMQRAYYKGLDTMNARGLLNSSMAGEAAQAAMMDVALPIAQADASTFYDQSLKNQGYANQFNLNDRQYLQQSERDKTLHGYDMERDNNSFKNDMDRLSASTSANLQGAYLKSVDDLVGVYADKIAQVEFLQGVSAEDKRVMIDNLIKERDRDMQRYQVLYSNMPTLNLDWTTWDDFTMPGVFDLSETTA